MIHWLIQSLDDCPEILRGDAPPGWLGAAERERLAGFKVEKRRRDWLLGRWTAKNLVQRYLAQSTGDAPALETIFIGADADGAPYAGCEGRGARGDERIPVSLSISHSHATAFCGLVEAFSTQRRKGAEARENRPSPLAPRPSLGCDLELIEPRAGNFLDSFFTAEEMAAVRALRDREAAQEAHRIDSAPATERAFQRTRAADSTGFSRFLLSDADFNRRDAAKTEAFAPSDILTTAIWSGKEAVLKALREGLRIDTRRMTCRFDVFDEPPKEWVPFTVTVDDGLALQFPGVWAGWWRADGRYVYSMALLEAEEVSSDSIRS